MSELRYWLIGIAIVVAMILGVGVYSAFGVSIACGFKGGQMVTILGTTVCTADFPSPA